MARGIPESRGLSKGYAGERRECNYYAVKKYAKKDIPNRDAD